MAVCMVICMVRVALEVVLGRADTRQLEIAAAIGAELVCGRSFSHTAVRVIRRRGRVPGGVWREVGGCVA